MNEKNERGDCESLVGAEGRYQWTSPLLKTRHTHRAGSTTDVDQGVMPLLTFKYLRLAGPQSSLNLMNDEKEEALRVTVGSFYPIGGGVEEGSFQKSTRVLASNSAIA